MTIQYQCDTSRDVIWCHDFGPTAPLRRQNLKTLYLDFPRSLSIVPKHAGPRYTLYESIHSISWPLVTIQCQYYTWRDVIWCHDFGSTAPLRRQTLESSYLDFLRSSMVVPTHVGTRYTLSGSIYLFSWPLVIIQHWCGTSRHVIWGHAFGLTLTAPLALTALKSQNFVAWLPEVISCQYYYYYY